MTAKKESALAIASAMLGGMEFTEVDDMVKSAIGELLNIIAGNAFSKVDVRQRFIFPHLHCLSGREFLFCFKALAQTNWFLTWTDNPWMFS